MLKAIDVSLATIEFTPAGVIVAANKNFCDLLGYSEAELIGKHHRIFVDDAYAQSGEYRDFWAKLTSGAFDAREYRRFGKNRREVWIQASYNPLIDDSGKVVGVIKVATDITQAKIRAGEFEGAMNAISRSQAVIEFTPQGEILTANANFLSVMGYTFEEIRGRRHSLFVESSYAGSREYEDFWRRLNAGEFFASSFKRIAKGGREVWIQASYNPVFDLDGRVCKVVKFANDITELTHLGQGLERLAANDVASEIPTPFSPTYERLRVDFNSAIRVLRDTLKQITETAQLVSSGAEEISTASEDLSNRTERQAASLEETAAALSQVTETVQRTAAGAVNANAVVVRAKGDAERSGSVVRDAVGAMQKIEKSSQEIEQIIGVIDEIAFQTNLLALNAGVEAARAGDAGRGFAVVASEVRALAQRSSEAAKAIRALIHSSKTEVHGGVKLVAETGRSLGSIVEQVGEINDVVSQIANGAGEQSTALREVNRAIATLDETTQQNAAMAEEATAAARSMRQEAQRLGEIVGKFKLNHGAAAKPEAAAVPRRGAVPLRKSA